MFVADCGLIWMFASTQVLVASALSPAFASPVSRWVSLSLVGSSVAALIVLTPAVVEVQVTVQEPVARIVWQVPETGLNVPEIGRASCRESVVPAGALVKPEP